MVREIRRLQIRTETLEEENDTLGEHNHHIEQIISSLKVNGQRTEIINRLKRGESHQAIAEWLGQLPPGGSGLSPTTTREYDTRIEQYHRNLVENQDPRFWTDVTQDAVLIEHLIELYLTWLHPTNMLFDEQRFMKSFRDCKDIYCSSSMVSAICAASCHLLHNTWSDGEKIHDAISLLRNRFLDEAKALIKDATISKMTTMQTYAIMSFVELGSGHGLVGGSHLRLATETLFANRLPDQREESEEIAAWGILTLHT